MRTDKKFPQKTEKKTPPRVHKRGVVGYSKKSALLEEAITHMNTGKYGRSSAALKELLALDPHNTEARRLFATLHLRLGSLMTARQAFESLANEAIGRQDYWLAESLLREYLAAGPRCVPFLELLAHVDKEKGDEMAAVAELAKAINILVEDPDTDNPNKPAQLYAKIRELAPVSPAAFQLSSLFDIQTGEFLAPHSPAPPASVPLDGSPSSSPGYEHARRIDSEIWEPMPWERVDSIPLSDSVAPSPPMAAPIECVDDSVVAVLPESISLNPPPWSVESAPSDDHANAPNLNGALSLSGGSTAVTQDPAVAPLGEPLSPTVESRDREALLRQPVSETPLFSNEQTPAFDVTSAPLLEIEMPSSSSLGSTALSSPMPWEQIEHNNISIQEVEPTPSVSPEPEPVAFATPPIPELSQPVLLEPAEDSPLLSTASPESSASTVVEQEPPVSVVEVESTHSIQPAPSPSVTSTPTTAPFSWNAIFDGIWKFGAETSAPSPPTTLSHAEVAEPNVAAAEDRPPTHEPAPVEPVSELAETIQTHSSTSESFAAIVETSAPLVTPPAPTPEWAKSSSASEGLSQERAASQPESSFLTQEPAGSDESPTVFQFVPSIDHTDWFVPTVVAPPPTSPSPSTSIPDASPGTQPLPVEEPPILAAQVTYDIAAPLSEETIQPPPPVTPAPPSHWSTGEVAVQTHRPSKKKRQWDKEKGETDTEAAGPTPVQESVAEEASPAPVRWDSAPAETVIPVVGEPIPREDTRPEWARASDAITLVKVGPSDTLSRQDSTIDNRYTSPEYSRSSVAASAVDVLFTSTADRSHAATYERISSPKLRPRLSMRLARVRQGLSMFIGSCFATTRAMVISLVVLVLACAGTLLAGIGAVGLAWIVLEEPASSSYQNLTTSPARTISDPNKNGYLLLLGLDAPPNRDPVQAGYERKVDEHDRSAATLCLNGDQIHGGRSSTGASASVMRGWFSSADPAGQFKGQGESIRMWAAEQSTALGRYQQWLKMAFDDWGYGQILSPHCGYILHIHRLYLAEGFSQDFATGLERLEADMGAWRTALGQSKTLMIKMLAASAIQDDVLLASAFVIRPEFDEAVLGRFSKIVRPLDQVELSVRWPMQSHLAWASKNVASSLKRDKTEERPLHVSLVAAMSLPVQRRSNAYADYYEAANKAVAEGRYANLPKLSTFVRTSGTGFVDYLTNPLEHVIGIEPMPSWDPYVGRMVETDARLRLASLQVWIRRGPQEGDLLARIAKAGQSHYDPVTGLPMLVNQKKGLLYSVGSDGKDQDADPVHDVVAKIPLTQSATTVAKRSVTALSSK